MDDVLLEGWVQKELFGWFGGSQWVQRYLKIGSNGQVSLSRSDKGPEKLIFGTIIYPQQDGDTCAATFLDPHPDAPDDLLYLLSLTTTHRTYALAFPSEAELYAAFDLFNRSHFDPIPVPVVQSYKEPAPFIQPPPAVCTNPLPSTIADAALPTGGDLPASSWETLAELDVLWNVPLLPRPYPPLPPSGLGGSVAVSPMSLRIPRATLLESGQSATHKQRTSFPREAVSIDSDPATRWLMRAAARDAARAANHARVALSGCSISREVINRDLGSLPEYTHSAVRPSLAADYVVFSAPVAVVSGTTGRSEQRTVVVTTAWLLMLREPAQGVGAILSPLADADALSGQWRVDHMVPLATINAVIDQQSLTDRGFFAVGVVAARCPRDALISFGYARSDFLQFVGALARHIGPDVVGRVPSLVASLRLPQVASGALAASYGALTKTPSMLVGTRRDQRPYPRRYPPLPAGSADALFVRHMRDVGDAIVHHGDRRIILSTFVRPCDRRLRVKKSPAILVVGDLHLYIIKWCPDGSVVESMFRRIPILPLRFSVVFDTSLANVMLIRGAVACTTSGHTRHQPYDVVVALPPHERERVADALAVVYRARTAQARLPAVLSALPIGNTQSDSTIGQMFEAGHLQLSRPRGARPFLQWKGDAATAEREAHTPVQGGQWGAVTHADLTRPAERLVQRRATWDVGWSVRRCGSGQVRLLAASSRAHRDGGDTACSIVSNVILSTARALSVSSGVAHGRAWSSAVAARNASARRQASSAKAAMSQDAIRAGLFAADVACRRAAMWALGARAGDASALQSASTALSLVPRAWHACDTTLAALRASSFSHVPSSGLLLPHTVFPRGHQRGFARAQRHWLPRPHSTASGGTPSALMDVCGTAATVWRDRLVTATARPRDVAVRVVVDMVDCLAPFPQLSHVASAGRLWLHVNGVAPYFGYEATADVHSCVRPRRVYHPRGAASDSELAAIAPLRDAIIAAAGPCPAPDALWAGCGAWAAGRGLSLRDVRDAVDHLSGPGRRPAVGDVIRTVSLWTGGAVLLPPRLALLTPACGRAFRGSGLPDVAMASDYLGGALGTAIPFGLASAAGVPYADADLVGTTGDALGAFEGGEARPFAHSLIPSGVPTSEVGLAVAVEVSAARAADMQARMAYLLLDSDVSEFIHVGPATEAMGHLLGLAVPDTCVAGLVALHGAERDTVQGFAPGGFVAAVLRLRDVAAAGPPVAEHAALASSAWPHVGGGEGGCGAIAVPAVGAILRACGLGEALGLPPGPPGEEMGAHPRALATYAAQMTPTQVATIGHYTALVGASESVSMVQLLALLSAAARWATASPAAALRVPPLASHLSVSTDARIALASTFSSLSGGAPVVSREATVAAVRVALAPRRFLAVAAAAVAAKLQLPPTTVAPASWRQSPAVRLDGPDGEQPRLALVDPSVALVRGAPAGAPRGAQAAPQTLVYAKGAARGAHNARVADVLRGLPFPDWFSAVSRSVWAGTSRTAAALRAAVLSPPTIAVLRETVDLFMPPTPHGAVGALSRDIDAALHLTRARGVLRMLGTPLPEWCESHGDAALLAGLRPSWAALALAVAGRRAPTDLWAHIAANRHDPLAPLPRFLLGMVASGASLRSLAVPLDVLHGYLRCMGVDCAASSLGDVVAIASDVLGLRGSDRVAIAVAVVVMRATFAVLTKSSDACAAMLDGMSHAPFGTALGPWAVGQAPSGTLSTDDWDEVADLAARALEREVAYVARCIAPILCRNGNDPDIVGGAAVTPETAFDAIDLAAFLPHPPRCDVEAKLVAVGGCDVRAFAHEALADIVAAAWAELEAAPQGGVSLAVLLDELSVSPSAAPDREVPQLLASGGWCAADTPTPPRTEDGDADRVTKPAAHPQDPVVGELTTITIDGDDELIHAPRVPAPVAVFPSALCDVVMAVRELRAAALRDLRVSSADALKALPAVAVACGVDTPAAMLCIAGTGDPMEVVARAMPRPSEGAVAHTAVAGPADDDTFTSEFYSSALRNVGRYKISRIRASSAVERRRICPSWTLSVTPLRCAPAPEADSGTAKRPDGSGLAGALPLVEPFGVSVACHMDTAVPLFVSSLDWRCRAAVVAVIAAVNAALLRICECDDVIELLASAQHAMPPQASREAFGCTLAAAATADHRAAQGRGYIAFLLQRSSELRRNLVGEAAVALIPHAPPPNAGDLIALCAITDSLRAFAFAFGWTPCSASIVANVVVAVTDISGHPHCGNTHHVAEPAPSLSAPAASLLRWSERLRSAAVRCPQHAIRTTAIGGATGTPHLLPLWCAYPVPPMVAALMQAPPTPPPACTPAGVPIERVEALAMQLKGTVVGDLRWHTAAADLRRSVWLVMTVVLRCSLVNIDSPSRAAPIVSTEVAQRIASLRQRNEQAASASEPTAALSPADLASICETTVLSARVARSCLSNPSLGWVVLHLVAPAVAAAVVAAAGLVVPVGGFPPMGIAPQPAVAACHSCGAATCACGDAAARTRAQDLASADVPQLAANALQPSSYAEDSCALAWALLDVIDHHDDASDLHRLLHTVWTAVHRAARGTPAELVIATLSTPTSAKGSPLRRHLGASLFVALVLHALSTRQLGASLRIIRDTLVPLVREPEIYRRLMLRVAAACGVDRAAIRASTFTTPRKSIDEKATRKAVRVLARCLRSAEAAADVADALSITDVPLLGSLDAVGWGCFAPADTVQNILDN